MTCIVRRGLCLTAFYMIATAATVATSFIPFRTYTLPLMWLAVAPLISAVMLLTFWTGIGDLSLRVRIGALLAGVIYLSLWPTVTTWLKIPDQLRRNGDYGPLQIYFENLVQYGGLGVVLCGMFLIVGRRYQFREPVGSEVASSPHRLQFSVFHLLVLMSTIALVLSLMRRSRGTQSIEGGFEPAMWAAIALAGVTLFANTACAAFAALGAQSVIRNCLLVVLTSVFLGSAVAFASRHEALGPWIFAGGVLAIAGPAMMVLASLLWLRPCGMRLVRRLPNPARTSLISDVSSI